jgi:hypothetical protein
MTKMDEKEKQCIGKRSDGNQCTRKAYIGDYCLMHYWDARKIHDEKNNDTQTAVDPQKVVLPA